jgi:hypothetical protein
MTDDTRRRAVFLGCAVLGAAALMWVVSLSWNALSEFKPIGVRWVLDIYDLFVSYVPATRWVVEGGLPYRDVPSEYPLAAVLLFGMVRCLAETWPIAGEIPRSFAIWWFGIAVFFLAAAYRLAARETQRGAWLWLTPTVIYFTLFRFDFYPAVMTLLALVYCRRERWFTACICFGVGIALKGYLLFALPAFWIFLAGKLPKRVWLMAAALTLAPFLAEHAAVWAWGGWKAVLVPYAFHARRRFDGASTFNAFIYLLQAPFGLERATRWLAAPAISWVSYALQVGIALAVAALRPRRLEDLACAVVVSVVAFWSLLPFCSPQFVLWIVPLLGFIRAPTVFKWGAMLVLVTYLYFPVIWDVAMSHRLRGAAPPIFFQVAVIGMAVLRIGLIVSAWRSLAKARVMA